LSQTYVEVVSIIHFSLFHLKEKKMKFNVGGADRIVRIVAGLALIALAATGTVGVWGWIGVVPLLTGVFKFCPAYLPFGISSCSMKKQG
jgi:O-antigen ligase